jgi:phosphohistidine phosphatase SixA
VVTLGSGPVPLLLVRHAWAGSRSEWEGDDRERPLDERGIEQARRLVERLADLPVERILTSPYRRCVETVEPLAAARDLSAELCPELGEDRQIVAGIALVQELAGSDVVVCGHGGLQEAVRDAPRWKKGSTFVVDAGLSVVEVRKA